MAPSNGRTHGPASLLAHAAGRVQPRRRLTSVRHAVTTVCRLVAPYVLTFLALSCAVAAAATYRPWAGLTAAAVALLLLELRVHIETRPDVPSEPAG